MFSLGFCVIYQERFLFYTSWKKQIELLDDAQAKRFVLNLCRYAEGEQVQR